MVLLRQRISLRFLPAAGKLPLGVRFPTVIQLIRTGLANCNGQSLIYTVGIPRAGGVRGRNRRGLRETLIT